MAAKVSVEVLMRLQTELAELCDGLQRSHQQVTSEANQLNWNDANFQRMLGFLDDTVQTLQMAKAGIDAYLPELGRHIHLLTDY